jgi:hypothetical protein
MSPKGFRLVEDLHEIIRGLERMLVEKNRNEQLQRLFLSARQFTKQTAASKRMMGSSQTDQSTVKLISSLRYVRRAFLKNDFTKRARVVFP